MAKEELVEMQGKVDEVLPDRAAMSMMHRVKDWILMVVLCGQNRLLHTYH
jgi:hypothetical protein